VAKRRRKKQPARAGKSDNKILIVVAVLAVLAVVFYLATGGEPGSVEEWKPLLQPGETMDVIAQDYYGYIVPGYTLMIEVNGQPARIEVKELNEDDTIDVVFNRRSYNLEVGETVMGDFDGDGTNDLAMTIEGVEQNKYRFSMTLTYFGELEEVSCPDGCVAE